MEELVIAELADIMMRDLIFYNQRKNERQRNPLAKNHTPGRNRGEGMSFKEEIEKLIYDACFVCKTRGAMERAEVCAIVSAETTKLIIKYAEEFHADCVDETEAYGVALLLRNLKKFIASNSGDAK